MLGQYYTVWDSGEFEKQEKVNEVVIKVNEWKKYYNSSENNFFIPDSRENKVSKRLQSSTINTTLNLPTIYNVAAKASTQDSLHGLP